MFSANLGGIFGLCLGGSIISIIELIWFFIELLRSLIKQWVMKAKINESNNKVFVVNNKHDCSLNNEKIKPAFPFVN